MYAIVSYASVRAMSSPCRGSSGAAGSVRCGGGDNCLSKKFTASGGACFQFIGLMHPRLW